MALLGATFLVGASALSGANAADVYARGGLKDSGGPVDYMPAVTWTGFYLGVHAGSTFDSTTTFSFDNADFELENGNAGLVGVHLGYNWQTAGNIVLGVEGSLSIPFDDDSGNETLSSLRGRLGYSLGKTLIYATGGLAFADNENADESFTGWVAGAGIEHKIRSNVSLGLEALYYSFEQDFDGIDLGNEVINAPLEVENDFWTIQARLTYHFGSDRHSESLK